MLLTVLSVSVALLPGCAGTFGGAAGPGDPGSGRMTDPPADAVHDVPPAAAVTVVRLRF
jgi:hypothetical protein